MYYKYMTIIIMPNLSETNYSSDEHGYKHANNFEYYIVYVAI